MGRFILSINIVFPIFFMVLLGWYLKRKNIINASFSSSASNIVFYLALPAKLFQSVSECDFKSLMNLKFIGYSMGITLISFLLFWLIGARTIRDTKKLTAFVHGGFRSNYVYMGIPIIQNILGTELPPSALIVVAFVLPLYNILAVILFSVYDSRQNQRLRIGKLLFDIIKNPMIIGILVALPFSLLQLKLPFAITKSIDYIGSIATPVALLLIGAQLQFSLMKDDSRYLFTVCLVRGIMLPLLSAILAIKLGFSHEEQVTLFVMMAAPTAANSYIMTKKLGGDAELAAEIILATILVSMLVLPIGAGMLA